MTQIEGQGAPSRAARPTAVRIYVEDRLASGLELALPDEAARHVQVRRLQPDDALTLFDGRGGEYAARVLRMGRRSVDVTVGAHDPADRGPSLHLEIALGMPANERMDTLVEKATELGAGVIHPLLSERSVLRLEGDRAARRVAHWQSVAVAASEQCGRTRVPLVAGVLPLQSWLAGLGASAARVLLSPYEAVGLATRVRAAHSAARPPAAWLALSGPEGGLAPAEESAARAAGFEAVSLGPLVLRADTAPLAFLAQMAVLAA